MTTSIFTEWLVGRGGQVTKGSRKFATTNNEVPREQEKSSHILTPPTIESKNSILDPPSSFREDPSGAEKVQASVNYILGANALVHALQAERGVSGIFVVSGGKRFTNDLETLIEQANTAWAETKQLSFAFSQVSPSFIGGTSGLDISQLQEMRKRIKNFEVDRYEVHDSYTRNIDVLLSTMSEAEKILEATPAGEILTKYLILLHLKEYTGRFRSLVGGMASSDTVELLEEGHIELVAILACITAFGKCFSLNAPSLQMNTESMSQDTSDQVKDIIAAIWESREAAEGALTSKMSPETWFKLVTKRTDCVYQMQEELGSKMDATAQEYCRDASVVRQPANKSGILNVLLSRGKRQDSKRTMKDEQEDRAQTKSSPSQVKRTPNRSKMPVHNLRGAPLGATKVLAACNYIFGVNALVHGLQAERGASCIFVASGGRRLGDLLETLTGHVDTALSNTKELSSVFSVFSNSFGGTPAGLDISQLHEMRAKIKSCEVDRYQVHDSYVRKIDVVLSTMANAVEILEATPIGEILSKYLILLYLKEHVGRFRAIIGGVTSYDTVKLSEKDHMELVANLSYAMVFGKCFSLNAPSLQMSTDEATTDNAYPAQVKDIIAAIWESREAAEAALANMSSETWFRLISQRMASISELQHQVAEKIQETVQQAYCHRVHDIKSFA